MGTHLPADLADALSQAEARLGDRVALRHFPEVDSTNEIALELAEGGAPEGAAVLADAQSAGRGRRGRTWFSPPGAGVYLSCIVRPESAAGSPAVLALAAGVAAADAIAAVTGLPVELKWPNDVVIGRPWRKLAGILCERDGLGEAIVVGIGINLRTAAYPADIAGLATSIEVELGRAIERAPLVVECLVRLFDEVERLRENGAGAVVDAWRRLGRAGLDRAPVAWQDQRGAREGLARDLDGDGALLVESDGRIERLIAGEVTWTRST